MHSALSTVLNPAPEDISPPASSRSKELGAFLRSRRESLDPGRMGLPRGGRRRTPGLRREEVAQLADVGVTWYTWLEQGRDIQVSAKVMGAIATALQCSEAETRHLFTLAGLGDTPTVQAEACERLTQANRAILDGLDPLPAMLHNGCFDILGANKTYCKLMGVDLEQIAEQDRNCIYLGLANDTWRARIADWDTVMPYLIGTFRSAMAEHMNDPRWERQLQRYMAMSGEFRQIWQRYEVRDIDNHVKRFRHPQAGVINLMQVNWWSAPKNGDRLSVLVPTDEASRVALGQLAAA